jgi:hypothetical protein
MPTRLTWILHRNAVGAAVSVEGAGVIEANISGEFAGAALVLEGSFDGVVFDAIVSTIRSPGRQCINATVKHLRPVVHGGGELTTIVATLTTSQR